jgi:hypothetical protein
LSKGSTEDNHLRKKESATIEGKRKIQNADIKTRRVQAGR